MRNVILIHAVLALLACDGRQTPTAPSAQRFGIPDIVVYPGESIQAAVDAAPPGATIAIRPGTYAGGIVVEKEGIKIIGNAEHGEAVVIDNTGGDMNGINVRPGSHGFSLVNVTLRGFERNGIFLRGVEGFLLSRITADNNGQYGLYPVFSSGVIERSSATGHEDAGIYVGQSSDVTVRASRAFGNVIGFEISNSARVKLLASEAYGNSTGILVALLPGRTISSNRDILLSGNIVRDNNLPNFATGGLSAAVPSGSGILVVGSDLVKVESNEVTGNSFVGIGVASSALLVALAGLPPDVLSGIEPDPDRVRVRANQVTGNGSASPFPFLPAADLFWDGTGSRNCWTANVFTSSVPGALPPC